LPLYAFRANGLPRAPQNRAPSHRNVPHEFRPLARAKFMGGPEIPATRGRNSVSILAAAQDPPHRSLRLRWTQFRSSVAASSFETASFQLGSSRRGVIPPRRSFRPRRTSPPIEGGGVDPSVARQSAARRKHVRFERSKILESAAYILRGERNAALRVSSVGRIRRKPAHGQSHDARNTASFFESASLRLGSKCDAVVRRAQAIDWSPIDARSSAPIVSLPIDVVPIEGGGIDRPSRFAAATESATPRSPGRRVRDVRTTSSRPSAAYGRRKHVRSKNAPFAANATPPRPANGKVGPTTRRTPPAPDSTSLPSDRRPAHGRTDEARSHRCVDSLRGHRSEERNPRRPCICSVQRIQRKPERPKRQGTGPHRPRSLPNTPPAPAPDPCDIPTLSSEPFSRRSRSGSCTLRRPKEGPESRARPQAEQEAPRGRANRTSELEEEGRASRPRRSRSSAASRSAPARRRPAAAGSPSRSPSRRRRRASKEAHAAASKSSSTSPSKARRRRGAAREGRRPPADAREATPSRFLPLSPPLRRHARRFRPRLRRRLATDVVFVHRFERPPRGDGAPHGDGPRRPRALPRAERANPVRSSPSRPRRSARTPRAFVVPPRRDAEEEGSRRIGSGRGSCVGVVAPRTVAVAFAGRRGSKRRRRRPTFSLFA
ncbi:hypothetical protein ACHAWF_008160, partial [Thalassiosira exigua]